MRNLKRNHKVSRLPVPRRGTGGRVLPVTELPAFAKTALLRNGKAVLSVIGCFQTTF